MTRANDIATMIKDGRFIDYTRIPALLITEHPTIVAGSSTATLSDAHDITKLEVYLNGVLLKQTTEYTISGTTLTLAGGEVFSSGDVLTVKVFKADANNVNLSFASSHDVNISNIADGELLKFDSATSTIIPTSLVEDGNGNVGIGNSSPESKLHVNNGSFTQQFTDSANLWTHIDSGANAYLPMSNELVIRNDALDVTNSMASIFFRPGHTTAGLQVNSARIAAVREAGFNTSLVFSTRSQSGGHTEKMRINSSGHMTKPDQPLFVGRLDAVTTTASNYTISVSQVYNRSMSFNSSTDRITVPTSGYYKVHAQQLYQSSGGIYLRVQVNGVVQQFAYGNMGTDHRDLIVNGIWYLNANDYVDFFLQGTSTYSFGGAHSLCYVQLVQ